MAKSRRVLRFGKSKISKRHLKRIKNSKAQAARIRQGSKFRKFRIINLNEKTSEEFGMMCHSKNPFVEALRHLFGPHELIDCQESFRQERGHPDFIVRRKHFLDFYVEYKSPNDSIHESQITWAYKN